jgi:hypothetical protein
MYNTVGSEIPNADPDPGGLKRAKMKKKRSKKPDSHKSIEINTSTGM